MPAPRTLKAIAALCVTVLLPMILPAHMRPTLIGRRAAIELIERADQHAREQGIRCLQACEAGTA